MSSGPDAPQPLPPNAGSPPLPRDFRKLPFPERRTTALAALGGGTGEQADAPFGEDEASAIFDVMVESAVGSLPVPLGIATGFLIDGVLFNLPMAVEEPSVIAAATYAAGLVARSGGFRTWATEPVMVASVYLEGAAEASDELVTSHESELAERLEPLLASMTARGGGYRGITTERLAQMELLRVDLHIDVRDAMGANLVNSAAERLREPLEELTGGHTLMAILTNEACQRRAGARFSLPVARLRRGGYTGEEAARRIATLSQIAQLDPSRAVTHNKGVMNGITSLALATGNDTRGIEAAVHRWASRSGNYRGVTTLRVEGEHLVGETELPLPFATRGGSVGFHPATRTALRLLGAPDAQTLSRVAAALGLAQNFAALFALATEGIQRGHMKLHSARLALQAGAEGDEVRRLASLVADGGDYSLAAARRLLEALRTGGE